MRITNTILQNNATLSLQQDLQQLAQTQAQVSSGNKYQNFSDDPEAQSRVMQTNSALQAVTQYQRNINDATARVNTEDTVLQQLTNALQQAESIATEQGTATVTPASNAAAKKEVDGLIQTVTGLGNTQYLGGYLFGGDNTTTAPISDTAPFYTTAAPPGGSHTVEISAGQTFTPNHNAKELFLDTNVLQSLTDLSNALGSNSSSQINAAFIKVQTAFNNVQGLVGDVGAREDQLQGTSANLTSLQTTLQTLQANLSGVDEAQAATTLASQQTTYQAALLATSKILNMNLTNYLT